MPSHLPAEIRRQLEPIRLLVLDVDGVLTDGILNYSSSGEEVKHFNVRDGLGIRLLLKAGIHVALITGRRTGAVTRRAAELGIRDDLVIQGSRDKAANLTSILDLLGLDSGQAATMGDDLPDLAMLAPAAFAACPADAAPEVIAACHMVCRADGGHGAVREVAELILKAQRLWIELTGQWTNPDAVDDGNAP